MKMKTGFRNTQWDPLLLIAQIIAVQSILYVCLGFLMAIMDILVGANHTLDHLFQYHVSVLLKYMLKVSEERKISTSKTKTDCFFYCSAGNPCH